MGLEAALKTFIFNNKADQLYLLTVEIVDHVVRSIQVDEHVVLKLKMVLIELLTNSLKHSDKAETIIEVALSDNKIIIKKTDTGNAFAVTTAGDHLCWPLATEHINNTIPIYGDITCTLKINVPQIYKADFFIEERDIIYTDNELIINLPEHFGLLIITRACHQFVYEFNPVNNTNNFMATILLKD